MTKKKKDFRFLTIGFFLMICFICLPKIFVKAATTPKVTTDDDVVYKPKAVADGYKSVLNVGSITKDDDIEQPVNSMDYKLKFKKNVTSRDINIKISGKDKEKFLIQKDDNGVPKKVLLKYPYEEEMKNKADIVLDAKITVTLKGVACSKTYGYNDEAKAKDLVITISDITLNKYHKKYGKDNYLQVFRYKEGGKAGPWLYSATATDSNAEKYSTSLHKKIFKGNGGGSKYKVKMNIVGAKSGEKFVFAMRDIDMPDINSTIGQVDAAYNDYSEGVNFISGFYSNTMKVLREGKNSSLLYVKTDGDKITRVIGSCGDLHGSYQYFAGFTILANAEETVFEWTGGYFCGDGICDFGQFDDSEEHEVIIKHVLLNKELGDNELKEISKNVLKSQEDGRVRENLQDDSQEFSAENISYSYEQMYYGESEEEYSYLKMVIDNEQINESESYVFDKYDKKDHTIVFYYVPYYVRVKHVILSSELGDEEVKNINNAILNNDFSSGALNGKIFRYVNVIENGLKLIEPGSVNEWQWEEFVFDKTTLDEKYSQIYYEDPSDVDDEVEKNNSGVDDAGAEESGSDNGEIEHKYMKMLIDADETNTENFYSFSTFDKKNHTIVFYYRPYEINLSYYVLFEETEETAKEAVKTEDNDFGRRLFFKKEQILDKELEYYFDDAVKLGYIGNDDFFYVMVLDGEIVKEQDDDGNEDYVDEISFCKGDHNLSFCYFVPIHITGIPANGFPDFGKLDSPDYLFDSVEKEIPYNKTFIASDRHDEDLTNNFWKYLDTYIVIRDATGYSIAEDFEMQPDKMITDYEKIKVGISEDETEVVEVVKGEGPTISISKDEYVDIIKNEKEPEIIIAYFYTDRQKLTIEHRYLTKENDLDTAKLIISPPEEKWLIRGADSKYYPPLKNYIYRDIYNLNGTAVKFVEKTDEDEEDYPPKPIDHKETYNLYITNMDTYDVREDGVEVQYSDDIARDPNRDGQVLTFYYSPAKLLIPEHPDDKVKYGDGGYFLSKDVQNQIIPTPKFEYDFKSKDKYYWVLDKEAPMQVQFLFTDLDDLNTDNVVASREYSISDSNYDFEANAKLTFSFDVYDGEKYYTRNTSVNIDELDLSEYTRRIVYEDYGNGEKIPIVYKVWTIDLEDFIVSVTNKEGIQQQLADAGRNFSIKFYLNFKCSAGEDFEEIREGWSYINNIEIVGQVYDFKVTNLHDGDKVWKNSLMEYVKNNKVEFRADELPIGQGNEQQNAKYNAGIMQGTPFYFSVATKGKSSKSIEIVPTYYFVPKNDEALKKVKMYVKGKEVSDTLRLTKANDNFRTSEQLLLKPEYQTDRIKGMEIYKSLYQNLQPNIGTYGGIVIGSALRTPFWNYFTSDDDNGKVWWNLKNGDADATARKDLFESVNHWYGDYTVPNDAVFRDESGTILKDGIIMVTFSIKTKYGENGSGNYYLGYNLPSPDGEPKETQWQVEGFGDVNEIGEDTIIYMPRTTLGQKPIEEKEIEILNKTGEVPVILYDGTKRTAQNYETAGTH